MKQLLILALFAISTPVVAQQKKKVANQVVAYSDSIFIKSIYNEALSRGHSHENLRYLCKTIGARLSGSAQAQMAVEWSEQLMKSYAFDTVYLQPIEVPYWVRGTKEAGWIKTDGNPLHKLNLLALGGSIGTNGIIQASIIEFKHFDDLKKANTEQVKGKIVFLNQPMNEQDIQTFNAYGSCVAIRGRGAIEAAKLGAIAVIIRSIGLPLDNHPHTGTMAYSPEVNKIPAAAISTNDAELLSSILKKHNAELILEMDCEDRGTRPSFNVIGEMRGQTKPEEIISVGGHLDSWDTGEGAHDDGAGVMHSLEAVRILQALGYRPKHTLRVVFFMNEENGNKGGEGYAKWVYELGEKHIAAVESDRGGFAPRGFTVDGPSSSLSFLQSLQLLFKPYDVHYFEKGYGGVDINPLKKYYSGISLFGFVPDSQRYFDFHHAPSDVFENVNKRELELGCATIATLLYFIDQHF